MVGFSLSQAVVFLYNMVRILVGALLYVGQKKLTPAEIKVALDKKRSNCFSE